MEPDLDGFRDASVRLRAAMGRELTYLTPTPTTWPPGTALNPESGEPYDPTIVPLASGFSSAAAQTLVVLPGGNDKVAQEVEEAIGRIETGAAALVIGSKDWDENDLDHATGVVIYQDLWDLGDNRRDSVGGDGDADRVIVHAKQKGRAP